jgi:hypothetical protein
LFNVWLCNRKGENIMKINGFLKGSLIGLLIVVMIPFGALSQATVTSGKLLNRAELDQLLASIALYPDPLLDRILEASNFPDQLAEADRWLKRNVNLSKDRFNDAMDTMGWDSNVRALAPFPQIIEMMVEHSEWTQKLGEAYMAQQSDIKATIQRLRSQAYAVGNLESSAQQQVIVKGDTIEIEPVDPQVVYVPRYDPKVVYGIWWWPANPPVAYYPAFPEVDANVGALGFFGAIDIGEAWAGGGDVGDADVGDADGGDGDGDGGRDHGRHDHGKHDHGKHDRDVGKGGGSKGGKGTGNVGKGGGSKGGKGTGNVGKGGGSKGGKGTGNVGKGGGSKGGKGTGNVGKGGGSRTGGSRTGSNASRGGSRTGSSRTGSNASGGGSRTGGSRTGNNASGGGSHGGGHGGGHSGGGHGGGHK